MIELDDELAESSWDEDVDGEADLDESEGLLDFLNPLAPIIQPLTQMFRPPNRPNAPTVSLTPSTGVNNATVATPRGQAQIQLPTSLVSKDDFNNAVGRLQSTINADSARINTLQKDLQGLGSRVGAVVSETQQAAAKQRAEAQRDLRRLRRDARATMRKLRADQQQQQTMSLVMSMMMQQQVSGRFDEHTHTLGTGTTAQTTSTPTGGGDDDSMMMMLPMMMMQPSGGSGGTDNSMMFMMMAMMMGRRD
jgi:tetrahydromethanopterin S-methyltransferase subunit G